jgi:UDP-galactopyranose mutase
VREFPQAHTSANEPFYPVPNEANNALYEKYAQLARNEKHVSFIGRLATYRYYNMDQVVGMALTEWEKKRSRCRGESAPAVIPFSKGVQFA